ncbi:hypothetical protein OXX69_000278 [Metschnikowia pulcherrima]
MKVFSLSVLVAASATLTGALPHARPVDDTSFDVSDLMPGIFGDIEQIPSFDRFDILIQKRDTTSTVEYILELLNSSDLLFDILDQIAYNPSRISKLANSTSKLLGGLDLGSITNLTKNFDVHLDLNASAIYNEVMDSGVVNSLLDGILLDTSYRPVLAGIVSRLLEGNKNLVNYMIRNVFKSSKRDQILSKRQNSGTLETFVGNVISTVLSSSLVSNVASDVLVALNETQFLTTTVKRFLANEGYQNMTAQLVLDMLNSGDITFNSRMINITSLADKALSKPQVLVTLVSNLLSGKISLPALGKYNSAVSAILKEVENEGVFADLNQYVFSETHSVTKPLLPTAQIVVPRTTSVSSTTKAARNSTSTKRKSSSTDPILSAVLSDISSVSKISFAFASTTPTSTSTRSTRSTRSAIATGPTKSGNVNSLSSAEVASLISLLQGMDSSSGSALVTETETESDILSYLTESESSTTTGSGGLFAIIQALGGTSTATSTSLGKRAVATAIPESKGAVSTPRNVMTNAILFVHAFLFCGLLVL